MSLSYDRLACGYWDCRKHTMILTLDFGSATFPRCVGMRIDQLRTSAGIGGVGCGDGFSPGSGLPSIQTGVGGDVWPLSVRHAAVAPGPRVPSSRIAGGHRLSRAGT